MAAVSGRNIGGEVLEAMGIDPKKMMIRDFSVHFNADDAVTLHMVTYVDHGQIEGLKRVFKSYNVKFEEKENG